MTQILLLLLLLTLPTLGIIIEESKQHVLLEIYHDEEVLETPLMMISQQGFLQLQTDQINSQTYQSEMNAIETSNSSQISKFPMLISSDRLLEEADQHHLGIIKNPVSEVVSLNYIMGFTESIDGNQIVISNSSDGIFRRTYTPWWAVGLTTVIIAIFVYFLFWLFKNCMSDYE